MSFLAPRLQSRVLLSFSRSCHNELSDAGLRKLRLFKRVFAYSLFGGTLLLAILLRRRRHEERRLLLTDCRPVARFANLPLYEFKNYVLPEPVVKSLKAISDFQFREEDIILASFPKTGECRLLTSQPLTSDRTPARHYLATGDRLAPRERP